MADKSLDIIIKFIQEGNAQAALTELRKLKGEAGNVGAAAGSSFAENFDRKAKEMIGNLAGKFAGVTGFGKMITALGVAGAGLSVGVALAERGISTLITRIQEWKKEIEEVAQVQKELRANGANEEMIGSLTDHVRKLAETLGVDLRTATAVASAELRGNYHELERLGVVIASDKSHADRLADALQAVHAGGTKNFTGLADAARDAGDRIREIETAANDASAALNNATEAIDRFAKAREKLNSIKLDLDLGEIEDQFKAGKITRREADDQSAAKKRNAAIASHEGAQADRREKIGANEQRISEAEQQKAERDKEISDLKNFVGITREWRNRAQSILDFQKQLEGKEGEMAAYEAGQRGAGMAGGRPAPDPAFLKRNAEEQDMLRRRIDAAKAGTSKQWDFVVQNVPKEFRDPDVTQKRLNELVGPNGENVRKADEAAAKLIQEKREAIAKLREEMGNSENLLDAELKKLDAEAGRISTERVSKDQKTYEQYIKDLGQYAESGGKGDGPEMPPELNQYRDPSGQLMAPKNWRAPVQRFTVPGEIPDRSLRFNQFPQERWDTEPETREQQRRDVQRGRRQRSAGDSLERDQAPRERIDPEAGLRSAPDLSGISTASKDVTSMSEAVVDFARTTAEAHRSVVGELNALKRIVADMSHRGTNTDPMGV